MFAEVPHSPQDVGFRLFGIPCRIHPFFWIAGAIFAWPHERDLPGSLMLGIVLSRMACLFVSILVHELGHAVLIRWAGFRPEIVLHGFGGYAMYQPTRSIRPAVLVAISFAGPTAGFLLYGLVCAVEPFLQLPEMQGQFGVIVQDAVYQLKYINLFWGLINLLPIYPLDGGQICRTLMHSRWGFGGLRNSLIISIIAAGGTAFYFYQTTGHEIFRLPVLLFGLLCVESIQAYQSLGYQRR